MNEDTATPETGPVDASNVMESVLSELTEDKPQADATEEIVAELVKSTEDEGQPATDPETEESATDPIEPEEESEEATQEEPEEPAQAEDPIHKVKVNGEEIEVPLSELLNGYSRTEDYKAKTMALADERRQVEAQKATIEQDVRLQYANELKQTIDMFEALDPVLSEARQIDWDRLKAEDPATFVQYSDAVSERLRMIEQHREKIRQTEQQQAQQTAELAQAEYQQRLSAAADKIVEAMPELAEGDNFQRFATDNIGYLRETGFTPEEINEAIDDRVLTLTDKARRWDALQRAKQGLPAKKVVPKSQVKPLTSDASESSRSSRRIPPKQNREGRVNFVIEELMRE
jgi:type II secretory pathway pseudopilin PulG